MNFHGLFERALIREKDGKPFEFCDFCQQPLDPNTFFVVAKAFANGRLVMEAAQCLKCQQDSSQFISEQSAENLSLYAGRRFSAFMEEAWENDEPPQPPHQCLLTGEELTPSDQFECYALHMPGQTRGISFLVGPTAVEQMSDLLSEETRKYWGGMIEQLEPISPEWVLSPMFLK